MEFCSRLFTVHENVKDYKGSGWGHTPRRWVSEKIGLTDASSGLRSALLHSLLQNKAIRFTGEMLNRIKYDNAMLRFQNDIIKQLKLDPRFRKMEFKSNGSKGVEFGGKRAPEPMSEQIKNPFNPRFFGTWAVAFDPVSWTVRHVDVNYDAVVKADGVIVVNFNFSERLDIRPNDGHTSDYNSVTERLGFIYHDVLGGNDLMTVSAQWQVTTK